MSSGDVIFKVTDAGLKKLKAQKNIPRASKYQLTRWGAFVVKYIKQVTLTGAILKVGSGKLRRSVRMDVHDKGNLYELAVGTRGSKYARIHEKGGTITPKRKKYLTIPLPGIKGWARNYPNAFVIKSKKGNLLIVERSGKTDLKPLFVLKKSVKIPETRWLSKSIEHKRSMLTNMLQPREVLKIAERM